MLLRMLAFVFLLFFTVSTETAHAEPVDAGYAVAEIITEREAVAPGDQFLAGLKLVMDDKWHVYWRNAGDAGIPPSISWTETSGAETGEFIWPAPHTIPLEGLMNYGYGEEVVLPFEVTAPATLQPGETFTLAGNASWQICLDVCLWEEADLTLTVPVDSAPRMNTAWADDIAHALSESPQDLGGEAMVERTDDGFLLGIEDAAFATALEDAAYVRFYPFDHEIEHFPEQPLSVSDRGGVLTLEASFLAPEGDIPLNGVVAIEQQDGRLLAFNVAAAPGDIPSGLGATPFTDQTPAITAPIGVMTILTWLGLGFLGGLILNLMPCVLPVLSIKANGLIHAAHEGDHSIRAHGLAYFAGVMVCFLLIGVILIVLRAAGEQAGLGFQLQYPPLVLGLSILMFAIGLNLLGVFEVGTSLTNTGAGLADKSGSVGAFFTGLLAAIVGAPCVGPLLAAPLGAVVTTQPAWMIMLFIMVMGAGMASPFLLLSFFPGLARAMPKPGRWMESIKQFFAFPMFLTAVGLLWVFAGQVGSNLTMLALGGLVLVMFGIWVLKRFKGSVSLVAGLAALILGAIGPMIMAVNAAPEVTPKVASTVNANVEHDAWSPEKLAALRSEGRPIFVDFTARWCVTCQFNKKTALQTSLVETMFAEHDIVFLTADWTNRDEIIAAELANHGRAGVPLYLFYPPGGGDPVTLPQLLRPQMVVNLVEAALNSAVTG